MYTKRTHERKSEFVLRDHCCLVYTIVDFISNKSLVRNVVSNNFSPIFSTFKCFSTVDCINEYKFYASQTQESYHKFASTKCIYLLFIVEITRLCARKND